MIHFSVNWWKKWMHQKTQKLMLCICIVQVVVFAQHRIGVSPISFWLRTDVMIYNCLCRVVNILEKKINFDMFFSNNQIRNKVLRYLGIYLLNIFFWIFVVPYKIVIIPWTEFAIRLKIMVFFLSVCMPLANSKHRFEILWQMF